MTDVFMAPLETRLDQLSKSRRGQKSYKRGGYDTGAWGSKSPVYCGGNLPRHQHLR